MIPTAILLAVAFRTVLVNTDATLTPLATPAPAVTSWNRSGWRPNRCPPPPSSPASDHCQTAGRVVLPTSATAGQGSPSTTTASGTRPSSSGSPPHCDTTGATPTPLRPARDTTYERTEPGRLDADHLVHRVSRRLRHRPAQLDEQRRRDAHRRGRIRHRPHYTLRPPTSTRPTLQRATPPRPGRSGMTNTNPPLPPPPVRKGP